MSIYIYVLAPVGPNAPPFSTISYRASFAMINATDSAASSAPPLPTAGPAHAARHPAHPLPTSEHLPAQGGVEGAMDRDAAEAIETHRHNRSARIKIVGFTAATGGGALADGIYKAALAGHIVDKFSADGELQIKDFAAVRLSTAGGHQVAAALQSSGLQGALTEIAATFESPLLKALPVDALITILNERGSISVDTLKAIDALLRGRSLSIGLAPAQEQQIERIGQWLRIALDNPGMIEELVDRIPLIGAKGVAEVVEMIGRVSAGVSPEQFFVTESKVLVGNNAVGTDNNVIGTDKNVIVTNNDSAVVNSKNAIGTSKGVIGTDKSIIVTNNDFAVVNSKNAIGNSKGVIGTDKSIIVTNNDSAVVNSKNAIITATRTDMFATLVKSAFSAAPTALLDLVKQIDTSAAPAAIPLPQAEAQRIARRIADSLSTNMAAAKPAAVHDSSRLSPQILERGADKPTAKAQAATMAVRQVISACSELTYAATRILAGAEGREDAAAIGEKINALRETLWKAFVQIQQTQISTQASVQGLTQPSVQKPMEVFIQPSAQRPVEGLTQPSVQRSIEVLIQPSAQTPVEGLTQPSVQRPMEVWIQPSAQTPVGGLTQPSVQKPMEVFIQPSAQTPIQVSTQPSPQAPDINAHSVKIAVDGHLPANKHLAVDKPVAQASAQASTQTSGVGADGYANINNSKPLDTLDRPLDIPAIKETCLRTIDALKTAVAPTIGELAKSGSVDAAGKAQLLSLIREAVSSLADALQPVARAERPVPSKFYERIAAGPKHQANQKTRSVLFAQIGAVQEAARGTIEAAERAVTAAVGGKGPSVANSINTTPTQSLPVDKIVSTIISDNAKIQQSLPMDKSKPVNPTTTIVSPQQLLPVDKNTQVNPATTNITPQPIDKNTQVNPAATIVSPQQLLPDNKNIPDSPAITNIPPQQSLHSDKNIPVSPANSSIIPQQPLPVDKNMPPPPAILQLAKQISFNAERLRAGFQEAFSSLDLQNRVSPLRAPIDKPIGQSVDQSGLAPVSAAAICQGIDSLRTEMLIDVSRSLREVNSALDDLREIISRLSTELKALPEAEKSLLHAAESLSRQARESGAEVEDRLKGLLRELSRLQSDAARAQERGGAEDMPARPSPIEAIRSAALTAARGLENLQLLAAQTRAAEAEQQFFALPAKIGGEWTEVQVKFVKERKGEGKAGDGHVSVYLNVAPSALGQVTAHLDYHPPSLKLSFQFEKPEATAWFRERSSELRMALAEAGLPGTALEFSSKRIAHREDIAAVSIQDSGWVDDGEGIVEGKVDFRV